MPSGNLWKYDHNNYESSDNDDVRSGTAPGKHTLTGKLPARSKSMQLKAARQACMGAQGVSAGEQAMTHIDHPAANAALGFVPEDLSVLDVPVQRKGRGVAGPIQDVGSPGDPEPPVGQPSHSGGAEMPEDVLAKMEATFGMDFSPVRIHEGPHAQAFGALAYTQGTNIHFAPGQYQPKSRQGQQLLGHELTHVVQQSRGQVQATTKAKGVDINDDASLEREADEMGTRTAQGNHDYTVGKAQLHRTFASPIQRQELPERAEQDRAIADMPTEERIRATAEKLILYYTSEHLSALGNDILRELTREWQRNPYAVVAGATILGTIGAATLTMLVLSDTRVSLPAIIVPLGFLARDIPVLRGAELRLEMHGPVSRPNGISFSVQLHEPAPRTPIRPGHGGGQAFTPRLHLRRVEAAGCEVGDRILIQGRIPVPDGVTEADVRATRYMIHHGEVEVDIGSSPVGRVTGLSVTDSFTPDEFGLTQRGPLTYLEVRLQTHIPPMFHQGSEPVIENRAVTVRINGVDSDGEVLVRVQMRPLPRRRRASQGDDSGGSEARAASGE